MQSFNRMQRHAQDTQAVHGRHQLLAHLAALADPTDDELPTRHGRRGDAVDRPAETIPRRRVRLVQSRQARQGRGLGRQHVHGRVEHGLAGGIAKVAGRWRDGQLRDGLVDGRHRNGHRRRQRRPRSSACSCHQKVRVLGRWRPGRLHRVPRREPREKGRRSQRILLKENPEIYYIRLPPGKDEAAAAAAVACAIGDLVKRLLA